MEALGRGDEQAAADLQQQLEEAEEGDVLVLEGATAEPRGWGAAAYAAGGLTDAQVQSLEEAMRNPPGQREEWDIDEELVRIKPAKQQQKKQRPHSDAQYAKDLPGTQLRVKGKRHVVLAVTQRRPRSGKGGSEEEGKGAGKDPYWECALVPMSMANGIDRCSFKEAVRLQGHRILLLSDVRKLLGEQRRQERGAEEGEGGDSELDESDDSDFELESEESSDSESLSGSADSEGSDSEGSDSEGSDSEGSGSEGWWSEDSDESYEGKGKKPMSKVQQQRAQAKAKARADRANLQYLLQEMEEEDEEEDERPAKRCRAKSAGAAQAQMQPAAPKPLKGADLYLARREERKEEKKRKRAALE